MFTKLTFVDIFVCSPATASLPTTKNHGLENIHEEIAETNGSLVSNTYYGYGERYKRFVPLSNKSICYHNLHNVPATDIIENENGKSSKNPLNGGKHRMQVNQLPDVVRSSTLVNDGSLFIDPRTNLIVDKTSKFIGMKSVKPFNSTNEYLYVMKEDLAEWLNSMYDVDVNADNFLDVLENGSILCQHANNVVRASRQAFYSRMLTTNVANGTLQNDIHFRQDAPPQSFAARDNVANFITWARAVGVRECLMFESDDLILRKNERNFVLCLLEIARYGAQFGLQIPKLVKLEKEIAEEVEDERNEEFKSFTELRRQRVENDQHSWLTRTVHNLKHSKRFNGNQSDSGFTKAYQQQLEDSSLHRRVMSTASRCTCEPRFPIIRISEGKYRIGTNNVTVYIRVLRDHVMVNVGNTWDTLENFWNLNDPCQSLAAKLRTRTDLDAATDHNLGKETRCESSCLPYSSETTNFQNSRYITNDPTMNQKKSETYINSTSDHTYDFQALEVKSNDYSLEHETVPACAQEVNMKLSDQSISNSSHSSDGSDAPCTNRTETSIGTEIVSQKDEEKKSKRPLKRYKKAKTTQLITPVVKITDCDLGTTREVKDLDWLIEHTKPTKPWYFRSAEAYQTSISNNFCFSGTDKDLESEAKAVIAAIENPVESSDSLEDIPANTAKISKPIVAKDVSGIPVSRRLVLKYRGSKSLPFAAQQEDETDVPKEVQTSAIAENNASVQCPTRVPRPVKKYGAKRSDKMKSQTEKLKTENKRDNSISRSSVGEYIVNDVTYRENRAYHWRKKALLFKNYMEENKSNVNREIGAEKQRFHYAELKGSEVIYGTKPIRRPVKTHKNGSNSHPSENELSLASLQT